MSPRNRLALVRLLFLLFLALSAVVRTALLLKGLRAVDPGALALVKLYGVGALFDIATFGYLAVPLLVLLIVLPDRVYQGRFARFFSHGALFGLLYLLLFDGVAEYFFFEEFGTRFNFIAVDYLVYTTEVLKNIRESYPIGWILGGLAVPALAGLWLLRRPLSRCFGDSSTFAGRLRWIAPLLLVPLTSYGLLDQSMTAISANNYANELAGNGIYDLFAAFRNSELDYGKMYVLRPRTAALGAMRKALAEPDARFEAGGIAREIRRPGAARRWNVVVVVEESLSADFLGTFGNRRGITPELDRLAEKSLLFTRMYATGTRTVRGLEAIALSLPPLPGTSLIKRPNCEGFASWGALMTKAGYDSKFLYAGYGYFDNMNHFFGSNGFTAVDRSDFSAGEVTFANAWGVCDEDLFGKVIREARKSSGAGRPFFDVIMTTSNHRPYTYPAGRIDIPSHKSRAGAVKYADFALGKFLRDAEAEPWFRDTLFVVVADHCAGSAGKVALPIRNYRIPLFFYAPAHVQPGRVGVLASQIDIAPTVLALLNVSYRSTFFGRDLLEGDRGGGRAFLSTYQKLGYLSGEELAVLEPGQKVETYRVSDEGRTLTPRPATECAEAAEEYYSAAHYVYRGGLNREVRRPIQPQNLLPGREARVRGGRGPLPGGTAP